MSDENYVGEIRWGIATALEQVDIAGFVFSRDEAPYLIGQARDGRIFVFNRMAVAEMIVMWQEAAKKMETT